MRRGEERRGVGEKRRVEGVAGEERGWVEVKVKM